MPQTKTIETQTADGTPLRGLHWPASSPQAVICLVHGLGEHIGRYGHFADYFNRKDIAVMGLDRCGHGKSGGKRGHAPSYAALLEEVALLEKKAKAEYPGTPVVIYGHSQGGNIVLNYEIEKDTAAVAVLSSAPWIRLSFEPPTLLLRIGKTLSRFMPAVTTSNDLKISDLSRSEAVRESYEADPLVHRRISLGMGAEMMEAADRLYHFEGRLPLPTLIMHGSDDHITSMPASRTFAQRAQGDVRMKVWEGLYHEIHNEPEQQDVFDYAYEWISQYI